MRRNGHSSAPCAGFGLTEAMIAVGIVATALLVLVQQLSIGFRESGANEDRAFAYQKASAILSELQNAIALGQIERGDQLLALADQARNFTLTTRTDHEGLAFQPGHPMSGNVTLGNEWRWSRTVSVEPHDHAGLYYCRVQIGLRDGQRWQDAASHALLFSLLPPSDAPEQTHDVYVIACAEASSQLGDLAALRDKSEEDPTEVEADEAGLNFVKLDGNVGCMVNGAGLAMATMDIIKLSGGNPANFLDVGGTANAERVEKAFHIILKDPNVKAILINIFGGIVRCDRVAQGIVDAYKNIGQLPVPLIVRLQGTNAEEAKRLIDESGLNVHSAVQLQEAADLVKEVLA